MAEYRLIDTKDMEDEAWEVVHAYAKFLKENGLTPRFALRTRPYTVVRQARKSGRSYLHRVWLVELRDDHPDQPVPELLNFR